MKTKKALFLTVVSLMMACGTGSNVADDEYVGPIPEKSALLITLDEDGSTSYALESEESPVVGDPAKFRELGQSIADGLNKLITDTHEGLTWLLENSEPIDFKWKGYSCKLFEGDGEKVHWQLTSCIKDKKAKKNYFVLRGRPVGTNDPLLPVVAGMGQKLPNYKGKWRGAGWIGYDLDNLSKIRGDNIGGKVGIGYRAAGKMRQINIGLKELKGINMNEPTTGIYRYKHIIGVGGRFSFLTKADVLAKDSQGNVMAGQDNISETLFAKMGWLVMGNARTVVRVCDGTLGNPKQCLMFVQCWDANKKLTFDELISKDKEITWDETQCPELPSTLIVDKAPDETDLNLPGPVDSEIDAPGIPEPEADPAEE